MVSDLPVIGRGIYGLSEAARLTGVSAGRIRRWTSGYDYPVRGGRLRRSRPLIATTLPQVPGEPVLDFADLIEVRFLNAFRDHGVSWKAIRIAAMRVREYLSRPHPFSTDIFYTDGRTILADVLGDDPHDRQLLDLVKTQYAFRQVVRPFLHKGLEFEGHEPKRWWPIGGRTIVIDPERSFGAPIVSQSGVPTKVLADSYRVEGSYSMVTWLYGTSRSAIKAAVDYESRLAQA